MAKNVLPGFTLPPGLTSGTDVGNLQRQLNKMGANLSVDGVYGPQTDEAYKELIGGSTGGGAGTPKDNSGGLKKNTGGGAGNTGLPRDDAVGPVGALPEREKLPNGYASNYVERDGKRYTEYGALLRDDGFLYSEGARISPNGMYYDIGNGWQYAKTSTASYGPYTESFQVRGSNYGAAPGSVVAMFDKSGSRDGEAAPDPPDTGEPQEEEELSLWEALYEEQLRLYNEERFSQYG